MQGGKKAGESMKETASNIGASAKAGMEKTKANVQEKAERMTARDPLQKELATEKKEARVNQAELDKQAARQHNQAVSDHNSAAKQSTAPYSSAGEHVHPTGHVTEGAVGSHPIGTNRGHNTRAGGNPNDYGYGSGGT